MRVVLAFLVWLFSLHTWKDFFLRWVRWSPPSPPGSGEIAREEQVPSQEGQQQSELSRFLSSLPQDECGCTEVVIFGDSKVTISFGRRMFELFCGIDLRSAYHEFLEAVASFKVVFREGLRVYLLRRNSCKHMEAFGDALRQSDNDLRRVDIDCQFGLAIPFAKCVSSVVLGNNNIQDLRLTFHWLRSMGKVEVAEFMADIASPNNLRILKSFRFSRTRVDEEGGEELFKPFVSTQNVLEEFYSDSLTSDVQLEHISGMLGTSTSLKKLFINFPDLFAPFLREKGFTRGYTCLATALCSNQSLKSLDCSISNSAELKALLDPLLPKNNNVQCNTTLTKLRLFGNSRGSEGIETLVEMLHTNSSLLELAFIRFNKLKAYHPQGIENVLAILKALKINKSLKKIDFSRCTAVGGYKVLGAMMDLLLENHCIEDIGLEETNMEKSGDAEYIYSALSKRKGMKLWDVVQGMANVNPTSGRVFLCGEPYAGKTRLRKSMKQWQNLQEMEKFQNTSRWGKGKTWIRHNKVKAFKVSKEEDFLERTHGIEVDNVLCDGIDITIWDMAGQTDYHSFHELVMPNLSANGSCSMFLLMSDPMKKSYPFEARTIRSVKR